MQKLEEAKFSKFFLSCQVFSKIVNNTVGKMKDVCIVLYFYFMSKLMFMIYNLLGEISEFFGFVEVDLF